MKETKYNSKEIEDKYNLISINELMTLLGYTDKRSVRNWCAKKRIPIIELGKNEYVNRTNITELIQSQLPIQGSRPPADRDTPGSGSNMEVKYVPESKIVAKYLAKYERKNKT
jgi:hypothetical protein